MKNSFVVLLIIIMFQAGIVRAVDPPIEILRHSIVEMIKNCQMNYETSMLMPDETKPITSKGTMAFYKNFYFDSSDARFVLLNDTWFIGADHLDKTIKVINMKSWKKEFGSFSNMNLFDVLLQEDTSYFNNSKMSLIKNADESYTIRIVFPDKSFLVKEIAVRYALNSKIPLDYKGVVYFPIEYENAEQSDGESWNETQKPISYAEVKFTCTNIQKADLKLFDHTRIIDERKGNAHIKKFQTYETFYSKKTTKK